MFSARVHPFEPEAGGSFRVGDLRIDPTTGRIAGPGGEVEADPRVMEVLVALARRPGEVVTREELLEAVWSERVVCEDVLSQSIYRLRRHLVAAGGHRRYRDLIQTLPKRGYRLNAEVMSGDEASLALTQFPSWRLWLIPSVVLVAVSAVLVAGWLNRETLDLPASQPIRSLAVLPLEGFVTDPAEKYFVDAMTEQLTSDLSRLSDLLVVSHSSVSGFRENRPAIGEIARQLGVDAVIEGAVWAAEDRVRITVRLVDGQSEAQLWAGVYVHEFRDLMDLQKRVARGIADQIRLSLSPAEMRYLTEPRRIEPEAQLAYLRGLSQFSRVRLGGEPAESVLESIEHFEQAIELEPDWAEAYAKLAGAYHWSATGGAPGIELVKAHFEKSRAAARKAIELDDSIADAYGALAFILHRYDYDWDNASQIYQRVFDLDPNNMHYRWAYALMLLAAGRYLEAAENFPVEQEPLSWVLRLQLSWSLACAGRYQEASAILDDLLEADSPEQDWLLANEQLALGTPERAIELLEARAGVDSPVWLLKTLAYAYAAGDRMAEARGLLSELESQHHPAGGREDGSADGLWRGPVLEREELWMPQVYAMLGETEKALHQLEWAWHTGARNLASIRCLYNAGYTDLREFEGLRDHPRFRALMERIALP